MTAIHISRPLDVPRLDQQPGPVADGPASAGGRASTDDGLDSPAGDLASADDGLSPTGDLASPAASALTAGLSLLAVLGICAGAAALIGFAFRAALAFFTG